MPFLIQYLIKLSISLAIVWIFYQLVLRRLTFYNWNRYFLLGYSLLAFFIPFINISPALEKTALLDSKMLHFIPVVEKFTGAEKNNSMDRWDWTFLFFSAGCLILIARLIIQHISFLRLRNSAKLVLDTPVRLYQINQDIIPFSFGSSIFINQHKHSVEDLKEIIRHEFVHVKQKHSIDMLCAEWLSILNWYNPFSWLIRNAIRQNLEFIADNKVVQNGIDKKQYQYLLLKVMGVPQYSIATNFNFTSLKKRIAMMNKMRSARVHLVKFLFMLPLIAVMLLSFRNILADKSKNKIVARESQMQDTLPKPPAPPAKPVLPKNVSRMVTVDNDVTVTLKDGTKEQYNLNKPEDKAAFEKKYGRFPEPPTPPVATPAPPPPAAPGLPAHVSSININNQQATIKLKNGKIEKYDLNKPNEKEAFEKKYGDITPAPPAVLEISTVPVITPTVTISEIEPSISVAPVISIVPAITSITLDVADVRPSLQTLSPGEINEVILEISNQSTSEQLTLLKKQLFLKGYTLTITNTNHNDGVLQSIDGTIADGNSRSRFVADDFSKVIITKSTYKNGKSGFNIRVINGAVRM